MFLCTKDNSSKKRSSLALTNLSSRLTTSIFECTSYYMVFNIKVLILLLININFFTFSSRSQSKKFGSSDMIKSVLIGFSE